MKLISIKFKYCVIALLLILNLSFVIFFSNYYQHSLIKEQQFKNIEADLKAKLYSSQYMSLKSLELNNSTVFNLNISEKAKYLLCLYISELHCSSCIFDCLKSLNDFHNQNPEIDILICTNFQSGSAQKVYMNNVSTNIKHVEVNNGNGIIFQQNFPVIFIFNSKESKVESPHFPKKGDNTLLFKYMSALGDKYFND